MDPFYKLYTYDPEVRDWCKYPYQNQDLTVVLDYLERNYGEASVKIVYPDNQTCYSFIEGDVVNDVKKRSRDYWEDPRWRKVAEIRGEANRLWNSIAEGWNNE